MEERITIRGDEENKREMLSGEFEDKKLGAVGKLSDG